MNGALVLLTDSITQRWEDFEYEYERPECRFAYFGNGQTRKETLPDSDMTPYLMLDQDLRDVHERWYH